MGTLLDDSGPTASVAEATGLQFRANVLALRSSKIMIVDDEPTNVKVARKYLAMEGYERFVVTTDAREASRWSNANLRTSCSWTS